MNKIIKYLNVAANIADRKKDKRSFLFGVIGIRADGVMVKAVNGPSDVPTREGHAEWRLARKLTPNSIVYVARIKRDGNWAMARPCPNCRKTLRSKGVKSVYYTISNNEYGVMMP